MTNIRFLEVLRAFSAYKKHLFSRDLSTLCRMARDNLVTSTLLQENHQLPTHAKKIL